MIELDNFTIGILVIITIIIVMIISAKMYGTNGYENKNAKENTRMNKKPNVCNKTIDIVERNRLTQMQIMNMKYENIGDDIIDYNNKPIGLFAIP